MRILLAHNFYQQPGGEDGCFHAEAALLGERGHEVIRYERHNDSLREMSAWDATRAALWNRKTYHELLDIIRDSRPDVIHFHNTFPLISPSGYDAARREGVPVVQTLHNFRLLCPNAILFRGGAVCEECVRRAVKWPAVIHACYRASRPASGVVAALLAAHRFRRTWTGKVTRYIALTEFARRKFIEGGLPADRIVIKPNFLHAAPNPGAASRSDYAIFVGRLTPEKGIHTLIEAWTRSDDLQGLSLKIVGDGPLRETCQRATLSNTKIEWLGRQSQGTVFRLMRKAICLVFPSVWHEMMSRVVLEAFASGTPVVAANVRGASAVVDDHRTGLLFRPQDADDLTAKLSALASDSARQAAMGRAARKEYVARYSPERNYELLVGVYDECTRPSRQ